MRRQIYLYLAGKFYFPVSCYFRFFAKIVLWRWRPTIVAVIGSAGKSNAQKLLAEVIKLKHSVKKSHKANSAFAIPLDILDIHIHKYTPWEWFLAALKVPFQTLHLLLFPYRQKYYLCELDVDRPGEMAFFAKFIKPKVIFWVSSFYTHTANFDRLVKKGLCQSSAEAVALEFAKLFKVKGKILGLVNADSQYISQALTKCKHSLLWLSQKKRNEYSFSKWQIFRKRTQYEIRMNRQKIVVELPIIAPQNFGYTVLAAVILAKKLGIKPEQLTLVWQNFEFNPGICSLLKGLNNSKIIDSSYNSSLYATKSLLEVLAKYPGKRKMAVLGDMRELGKESAAQHKALAKLLLKYSFDQVVLVGPEMQKYVYPCLQKKYADTSLHYFDNTYQAGLFIKERLIKPGDVVLLKASQNTLFFEIIAKLLLVNPKDEARLCRRAPVWEKKRLAIKNEFYKLFSNA